MKRNNDNNVNLKPESESSVPAELIELYANRKPVHDENCVYRLRVKTYGQISCYDEAMAYPKFAMSNYCDLLYRSLEDAKAAFDKMMEDGSREDLCYFTVTQIELGDSLNLERAVWLFDGNSQLLDYSVKGRYFGRTPERARFRKGDIVEVITDNLRERFISLAVVVDTPPSSEECWKLFNESIRTDKGYSLASCDDCYTVADTPACRPKKVQSVCLLPARFPIDDTLKEYFNQCLDSVSNGDDTDIECKACIDCEDLGIVAGLHVYIDADAETHTPLLNLHSRGDSFQTSLRIDCASYYRQSDDRLASWQKYALADFLETMEYGRTRWWYLIRSFLEWPTDYDIQLPLDTPIPDYRQLPN